MTPFHILLVDDDSDMRTSLRRVLERAGHTVVEARNGKEAILLMKNGGVTLVITDIIMPESEGLELTLKVRRSHPGVPVIVISGGARVDPGIYLDMAKQAGAVRVYHKPLDIGQFLADLESLARDRT